MSDVDSSHLRDPHTRTTRPYEEFVMLNAHQGRVPLDLAKRLGPRQECVLHAVAGDDTGADEAVVFTKLLVEHSAPLIEGRGTVAALALPAGD
jgi:hypothetical protein